MIYSETLWKAGLSGNNYSGFGGKATGHRHQKGEFREWKERTNYHTSSMQELNPDVPVIRRLRYDNGTFGNVGTTKVLAHAVRCIKDN